MTKAKYNKLRSVRAEHGMTQKEVSELLEISQTNYSKKETGEVPFLLREAIKLSELFNIPVEELFKACAWCNLVYRKNIGKQEDRKVSNLIKINNQDLQVKEFNNQRVVTFKDIDMLHERVEGTAGRNFSDNKKHFIKDSDYFHLSYEELRSTNFVERPNPKGLILITESGYLMLVKSLNDDLAWKVQRELINNYFRVKEDPYQNLSKELQAVFILDKKTQEIETRVDNLESNMPLFNIECKEIQSLVRKVGIKALGGYKSPAYDNNSLRGKVYADIQHQLKREFGVNRYEAIKRSQLETAKRIIEEYKGPTVLANEIQITNNQISYQEVACGK